MRGFSPRNVWHMRSFYLAWPGSILAQPAQELGAPILKQPASELSGPILTQPASELTGLPQPVAEIPWFHNVILIRKLKRPQERLWYAQQTFEHGWSRPVLIEWIKDGLYQRQGKAVTNFKATLPPLQSDLAEQTVKDPYLIGFIPTAEGMSERDLETGLIEQIQRFLIELGVGFAFVGRQVRLDIGGEEYSIDLLFYHLRLRCYVVVELKAGKFKPEYAGKMNFYLSAVDQRLRHPDDQPSIGLILCKAKHRLTAEYALRGISTPIGIADWKTSKAPEALRQALPSVAQLEAELRTVLKVQ
jgi:predicted nuclease of restriction endonuclease-like (RecB) superfamily